MKKIFSGSCTHCGEVKTIVADLPEEALKKELVGITETCHSCGQVLILEKQYYPENPLDTLDYLFRFSYNYIRRAR